MADPIIIKDQKFTKVKGIWVDQKKNPAPKELITLLDKLAETYLTPPLPTIQSTKEENTKVETALAKLTSSVEKLVRSVDKLNNAEVKKAQVSEEVAQRVSSTEKIPSLMGAAGSNVKEFFTGKKDEYGRVTQSGLLRNLTKTILPPAGLIFAAQDRRREALAQQKISNTQNSTQSIINNKSSTSNSSIQNTNYANSLSKSEELAKAATLSNVESTYEAKKFDSEKVQAVKIVSIDESSIKKLLNIFGKNEERPEEKPKTNSGGGGLLGGFFAGLLIGFKGLFGKIASFVIETFGKIINFVKGLFGKGVGVVADGAKAVSEFASSSVKRAGGALSKLFGGGARSAAVETAEKVVEKEGTKLAEKSILKSALKKIPVVGLLAGGAFAADRALKGDFSGAGLEVASGAASLVPGVGTAASLGIDAAIAARDMGAFSKIKPAALSPTGLAPQTQALNITTKRVIQEKEKKAMTSSTPVITNISSPTTNVMTNNQTIAGMTMGPRGSLDIETYRTRGL